MIKKNTPDDFQRQDPHLDFSSKCGKVYTDTFKILATGTLAVSVLR